MNKLVNCYLYNCFGVIIKKDYQQLTIRSTVYSSTLKEGAHFMAFLTASNYSSCLTLFLLFDCHAIFRSCSHSFEFKRVAERSIDWSLRKSLCSYEIVRLLLTHSTECFVELTKSTLKESRDGESPTQTGKQTH